jgi:hypothetical protein
MDPASPSNVFPRGASRALAGYSTMLVFGLLDPFQAISHRRLSSTLGQASEIFVAAAGIIPIRAFHAKIVDFYSSGVI